MHRGYGRKDLGKPTFRTFFFGFKENELDAHLEYYRMKAGDCMFSSSKMNKAPGKDVNLLSIKLGGLFTMINWFVARHKLTAIAKYVSISIVVAWALETGRYRLDESFITGRSGGGILDPGRSQAMMDLSFANTSRPSETIPLIETILLGEPQECVSPLDEECRQYKIDDTRFPASSSSDKKHSRYASNRSHTLWAPLL